MSYQHILYENRNGVAYITFNHPERRNSFDHEMMAEFGQALLQCHDDPTVGVVVVTGAGDKGFCAGGYLADLTDFSPAKARKLFDAAVNGLTLMRRIRQPVIAAVNGAAIGGGNEVVICADLAIAADNATFGQVGPKIGSSPFFGGTNLLALTIGEKKAREVVYMCKQYTAQQALEMGMVNVVVPKEKLYEEVETWAQTLLDRSPSYLEMSKVGANCWFDMLMPSFEMAKQAMTHMAGNAEQTEGASAFMEKRKPNFRQFRK